MKISDLFENKKEQYDDKLKRQIMDVLVLYNVTGTNKTNINNIVTELNKEGLSVDRSSLEDIIKEIGFDVEDEMVIFSDNIGDAEDYLDDGEDYDPVSNMASNAMNKRMK